MGNLTSLMVVCDYGSIACLSGLLALLSWVFCTLILVSEWLLDPCCCGLSAFPVNASVAAGEPYSCEQGELLFESGCE